MNTTSSVSSTTRKLFFPSIYDSASKPTYTTTLWISIELLLILSYAVKPNPYRPVVFFLPVVCLILYSLLFTRMRRVQNIGNTEWGMGCRLAANILFASTNILLCDVQKELKVVKPKGRRVDSKKDDDQLVHKEDVHISEQSFLERFKWAFKLWFTPCGVHFAHQTGTRIIPRPTYTTRTSFLLYQSLYLLYDLLVYDIVLIICRANPYFSGHPELYPSGYLAVFWRLFELNFGLLVYLVLTLEYRAASLIFVGLGLSDLDDWPDMFGSFKYAYTLRGLWGKTWHQMFRRPAIVHAQFLLRKLKVPPKSRLAPFFILFCAFVLTGLIHHVGDAMVMQSWTKSRAIYFFLSQAVGIAIEDVVIKIFKANKHSQVANLNVTQRIGENRPQNEPQANWTTKLLGYSWVVVYMAMTLPMWTGPLFEKGTFIKEIPHFSIVLGLWKGEWSFEGEGWPLIPDLTFDH